MSLSRPARHLSTTIFTRAGVARITLVACALLVVGPLATLSPAVAAAPGIVAGPVNLGSAAGFSALAGPSITNTGAGTVLALDLGVSGTLAGFPPGTVTGTTRVATPEVATAQEDRQAAYDSVVAQAGGTAFGGDLAGTTFTPGLYSTAAAVTNTGTITLDAAGDPSARFIFQIGAAMSSAAATKVVLANGALANNVYWQVVGAVAFGANVKWVGTVLGAGVISFGDGASLKGRALTASTMALANSPITKPIDDLTAPLVTINGGPTRSTNDMTPSISGTTDEPGTPLVTVTVGAQVLTQRANAGVWSLSTDALPEGVHPVVASVSDPSGNVGSATQTLTVDTTAPGITITGGPTEATSDLTPTISGTTNEPGTPSVTVLVGGQSLTVMADAGGAWTVDAGTLTESSHSVVATVVDAAGNAGSASQVLTVDVTVPVLTIDGGATRSTSDTSPWTYGTTAEQAGTIVQVTLDGQALTATVKAGGTWGVSAQTVASGTYTVVASITDAAGNTGTMTQTLHVAGVAGDVYVAIDGGATRGTNDPTPSITGTTGEPGTPTVTVTVSGQTLTTTATAGVWSVEAAILAEASHTVAASITANGSTGTATQVLTVDVTAPVVTIDGGASRSTNDLTPWTYGTTPEAAGAVVRVTVGGQTLTTSSTPSHTWGVSASSLTVGTYVLVASITDAAGNTGSATQSLQVTADATPAVVGIDGGTTNATNDTTPTISGTSTAPIGTAVSVAVSGQMLSGPVTAGGLWTVEAATLALASHTVVATVTVGGATNTATQNLTVDTTAPVLTIEGGPARSTTDSTPRLQGTTTESAGALVRVYIGSQSLVATVSSLGAWSVGADTLAEGTYTVVASITDLAQNTTSATQTLEVTGVVPPPGVAVSGGANRSTNDVTPTIAGTSDAPVGTAVTVTVAGQGLASTVGSGGTWSVEATTLTEAAYTVTASVTDGGSTSTGSQVLTIDLTAPLVTITGGAARSTIDTTPRVQGTATEPVGTSVQVTVGGQSPIAIVLPGAVWGVGADTLAEGTHTVVASVTDAAGNTGMATQALTIVSTTPTVIPDVTPPVTPPATSPGSSVVESKYLADAEIRPLKGTYLGAGVYSAADQRVALKLRGKKKSVTFEVRVTNRGDTADKLQVLGTPKSKTLGVAYLVAGKDVTATVLDGSYRTDTLKAGESVTITVKVVRLKAAKKGNKRTFEVKTVSSQAQTKADTVSAVVKVA